jgi:hypothetical protein
MEMWILLFSEINTFMLLLQRIGGDSHDRMVIWFTTTCVISVYYH